MKVLLSYPFFIVTLIIIVVAVTLLGKDIYYGDKCRLNGGIYLVDIYYNSVCINKDQVIEVVG